MNSLWQEVRFSFRMFIKKPVFTLVIVITLALGIGANTAIFSLVDAVLLKKLPVREPDQVVLFKSLAHPDFDTGSYNGSTHVDAATGLTAATSFPFQTLVRLREQKGLMSEVFAFAGIGVNVNVDGEADIARAQVVSGNYHAALGVQPALGRMINDSDDQSSATPVAVISDRYWQRRFNRDPAAVGKQIKLNNVAFTIVGITPSQFTGTGQVGSSPDISVPLALEPQLNSERSRMKGGGQWWLRLMGRLQPGVTREQARASLESAFQESVVAHRSTRIVAAGQAPLPALEPKDLPKLAVDSGSQGEMDSRRRLAPQLYILLGVVALVLLIACANVANLLLVNASSRQREIAVRLALGSSRWRLIRMLLTESVLLSLMGGALGLILASWIKDALLAWASGGRALLALNPRLDFRVLGFTIGLALLTAILFGLVPAWRSSRMDLTPSLKETPKSLGGLSRSLLSKSLVVAQVAMSLLLLIGAGLFLRTLHNLQNVPTGFNSDNLLLFNVEPGLLGYKNAALADLYKQMFERIESVPGVRAVTLSRNGLLSGATSGREVYLPIGGISADASPRHLGEVRLHQVRENFFATMEIPLLSGRSLSPSDHERAPKVAVINQSLAALVSPDESPLGKRFGFAADNASEVEVVGVVGDSKYGNLRDDSPATFYVPWLQELRGVGGASFAVRTTGEPTAQAGAIRNAVREVEPDLPLIGVTTQVELADQSVTTERLFARLLSLFGVVALVLAAIGLYGVMAYSVTQRTREIGIRMALGAQRHNVLKLVLSQGIILTLLGIAVGAAAAFWLTRLTKSMLFGVSATDPATFVAIALLLSAVALLATYIPARRATKVNPLVALRYE
ncbi:MAG TPA: ABC transporter permease [Pyrinomonadaceae bacterium]|nr:ABC transporter permease [Pyrinomonadaceae bacterium]